MLPLDSLPFPSSVPCEKSPSQQWFSVLQYHQDSEFLSLFLFIKNQIQSDVENVQMAFKRLQEFLDFKEKSEKQKLMQEKEDVMNSLAESQNELMKQREAVRDLISDVEHQLDCSTMEMLQTQIQSDVENVQMEFKRLRGFLDSKEKNEVQKLMQEKEDVMNSLAESQNEVMKQREAVRDLISDVEHQLDCSTMEMLQGSCMPSATGFT
ncbi:hypothetical protein NN561_004949 [Cricetulus griseus]